jgi:hypothetical protein
VNFRLKIAAAAVLASSLVSSSSYASGTTPTVKKHIATKKAKTLSQPSVQEQIEQLRRQLESHELQINALKTDLAEKDAQLKSAQLAASEAQASAAKTETAAASQQLAVTENTAAVTTLQSSVTDIKGSQVLLAATVSDETAKIKKDIANPSALHYKGITLTPGGYIVADTAYRGKATGGDVSTAFSSLPYEHADAYALSEFIGSSRQSRLSLLAEGRTSWGTLRGYYEVDFLGTGVTSNNNQSNSYLLRQRVLYAQAETNSHWTFAGGQMWSLATEGRKGIPSAPSDIATPQTIDPNYLPGFIWARQYGFRVVKSFNKSAFGAAIENPQLLYAATLAGNTPYAILGSAGLGAGMFNGAVSSCSPSTSIVNYINQAETVNGVTVNTYLPVYKTLNSCANLANISFNKAPDVLVKATFDPGLGHYEIFGIAGFAHETVYPGETTNSNLYGGLTDIKTGALAAPALTTAGSFSSSIVLGGIGGSLRIPVLANKLTVGVKGLYGPGMGRYGTSNLSDVTANSWGGLAPIHNLSGLFTVEANPTPRLSFFANYGGDYAGRSTYSGATLTAPSAAQNPAGVWGGSWKAPSAAAVGYGSRLLNNSSCSVNANPGYNGGSTGYYAGGSCGAQTRNTQEFTGGYWYDLYKGDRGRLRQGGQYGYAVREGWSGASGIGAKGIDNMFWTTFRYYLP